MNKKLEFSSKIRSLVIHWKYTISSKDKGIFTIDTVRNCVAIDLWIFEMLFSWDSEEHHFRKGLDTLLPNGRTVLVDEVIQNTQKNINHRLGAIMYLLDIDPSISILMKGFIGPLDDVEIFKEGESLFQGNT